MFRSGRKNYSNQLCTFSQNCGFHNNFIDMCVSFFLSDDGWKIGETTIIQDFSGIYALRNYYTEQSRSLTPKEIMN